MEEFAAIHYAAQTGDLAAVQEEIAKGADVNAFDDIGFTPLHHGSTHGHVRFLPRTPMKLLLATALLWLHICAAVTFAQRQETALSEALKDWKTVRISLVMDGGDYNPPSPFILLQRLDSNRVILSSSEASARSELLPVARAIITSDAAQRFIDRASAFYAQAQKETGEKARVYALPQAEREPILKKHNLGMSALYIGIQVFSHNRSFEYQDDFADNGTTVKDYAEFVMHPKADSK